MPMSENRESPVRTKSWRRVRPWPELAGHWLQNPAVEALETEIGRRRQAALRRWRGLVPESDLEDA